MMGKGISVKVQRVKMIDALMGRLDDMEYQKAQYDIACNKYEEARRDYKNAVADVALKYMTKEKDLSERTSVRHTYLISDAMHIELAIEVPADKLPEEPKCPDNPFQSHGYGRNYIGNYDDRKADILNAIRILQLSDEDIVSTATYAAVAKYL